LLPRYFPLAYNQLEGLGAEEKGDYINSADGYDIVLEKNRFGD
jgi:hypothetical protein